MVFILKIIIALYVNIRVQHSESSNQHAICFIIPYALFIFTYLVATVLQVYLITKSLILDRCQQHCGVSLKHNGYAFRYDSWVQISTLKMTESHNMVELTATPTSIFCHNLYKHLVWMLQLYGCHYMLYVFVL